MMAGYSFSDDYLRELRDRNDITEVISAYVNLKKTGANMKGLCPFHNERTPSFTVFTDTQSFYCFGCGASGTVIHFIMKINNLGFVDAVKYLAQRAGMSLPEDGFEDTRSKLRRRVLAANKEAARFYNSYLLSPEGRVCLDYYLGRGYSPKTIKHFGLGYAPDKWSALTDYLHQEKGFSLTELVEANLTRKSEKNGRTNYYDNFRNRAMVPIIDVRGNVVAFGGRVLDDSKPKYVNTSDTVCYKKGSEVFGLNFAKDSGERRLIITEGYMDTIALHQAGFTNSIASLGTALPDEQVNLISRYADEVLLSYDADEAGQRAVARAMTAFARTGVRVRVLRLKGGKDPDEIIKKYGPDRFRAIVEGAENDIEFSLAKIKSGYDLTTDDGKVGFMREAVRFLAGVNGEIERDVYITKLSNELNISKESIAIQVDSLRRKKKRSDEKESFNAVRKASFGSVEELPFSDGLAVNKAEETLLVDLIRTPAIYRFFGGEIDETLFFTDFGRQVFRALEPFLERSEAPDLILLSDKLSEGYLNKLIGLVNVKIRSDNVKAECRDCIKLLKAHQNRAEVKDVAALDDTEFLKLFGNTEGGK